MATAAEIQQLYTDILEREADTGGLDFYLNSGKSLEQIRNELTASQENIEQDIEQAYLNELGRAYDQEGYDYWVNQAVEGNSVESLNAAINAINMSEEGRLMDPTETLGAELYSWDPALYSDYVNNAYATELGRTADEKGFNFYLDQLESGGMTVAQVLQDISSSVEGRTADTANIVFNEVADQQVAADSGLFDPFNNVYTDPQAFADRTAAMLVPEVYGDKIGTSPWTANGEGGYNFDAKQAALLAGAGQERTEAVNAALAAAGLTAADLTSQGQTNLANNAVVNANTPQSNYGQYGKRADESLTEYYDRLSTEREGGILGQGLLSASPTVGSEAWEAMQAVYDDPAAMQDTLNQVKVTSSGNYEPIDSSVGMLTPTMRDVLQRLAEAPALAQMLIPALGAGSWLAKQYVNDQASDTTNNYLNTGRGFSEDGSTYTTSWGDVVDTSKLSEAAKRGLAISLGDQANYSEAAAMAREDYGDNGTTTTSSSDIIGGSNIYTDARTNAVGDAADPLSGITVGEKTVSDAQFERDVLANGLN